MARVKQVNIGGTAYDVADKVARNTLADEFSTSKAYAVGDYCIYDNTLYKCTTDKTAGAWSASYFASTTVAQEIPDLEWKTVSGTGCNVRYNDAVAIIQVMKTLSSAHTSGESITSEIMLPSSVTVKGGRYWYAQATVLTSGWNPTSTSAHMGINGDDKFMLRANAALTAGQVIIGQVVLNRSYLDIA